MRRWLIGLTALLLVFVAVVLGSYLTLPTHDTDLTHFDVILVLGCPADPGGAVSPEERERVLEGVREFRAGRAGRLILSGGAAHNQWIESGVMSRVAIEAGVPAEDVLLEDRAENTIQNVFYSQAIMAQHGWHTVEVVSSPSHLPRAGLILEHWPGLGWRTHAAHWPAEYRRSRIAAEYIYEALGTTTLRWFGFKPTRFLPGSTPR